MNKQTEEHTQFNVIKELISEFATSQTVKDRLLSLEPTSDLEKVRQLQAETGEALEILKDNQSIPFMMSQRIDRIFEKVEEGYVLDPKELHDVEDFLRSIKQLKQFFEKRETQSPILSSYCKKIVIFNELEERLSVAIKNNQVSSEASSKLKKARQRAQNYQSAIRDKLYKFINSPSNKSKIQEFMVVEKNGSLTVPLKSSFKTSVAGRVVSESAKGSTVYVELDNTKSLTEKLQEAHAEEIMIVYEVLADFSEQIASCLKQMKDNTEIVFKLEEITAKATYSLEIEGEKIRINDQGVIKLVNARHPLLKNKAVPLSMELGGEHRGLVITGSNSGGKTVVLKTIGLLTLMTMVGIHVPAEKETEISTFNHVLVDIGDYQDIDNALSTFSGHMSNMKQVLDIADTRSLVLVDEIGSGTEPSEGAALAMAMLDYMIDKGAIVVASTHYGEIKEFAIKEPHFVTAAMAFNIETLEPLYQLLMNEVGQSNGLWLAKKMLISDEILERAQYHMNQRSR
ncbi:endonuclease MutS2 [Vagococcus sp. PNs007]|uniref:Endonuclease MutS2 n=1 Tax=Vagococcus proximus TaxID=2991417 RepID=A0ABT5X1R6_9ENTE|nr:endonuclease MutS2 [Vagococcus proximus]MDF0479942.1 endonuclease MutS2 [Vagococcus proximus]